MDAQRSVEEVEREQPRSALSQLSNAMVRIYKDQFGRGPVKAKTSYADANTIISTLESTLTPAEQKMRDMGEHQRLEETRLLFQRASRKDFTRSVEQITGRTVRAFVSGTDPSADVSSEVFYLEPVAA